MINKVMEGLRSVDFSEFTEDYVNDILDNRDIEEFDSEWCRVDEEIGKLKNDDNYSSLNQEEHDKICKEAFFIIEDNYPCELSDYISDDLGLIYDSLVVGYKDEWLDKLIKEYENGRIPTGEL